jgi:hypothetical protein
MADEVHVTTSQADAAKMIVERNSANGKPTAEAIRKIAEAQVDPAPETPDPQNPGAAGSSRRKGPLRAFLTRISAGRVASKGAGVKQ